MQEILKNLNVFEGISPDSKSQLHGLDVWDGHGAGHITFNAHEVGQPHLGYILENREIIRSLWISMQSNPNAQFFMGQTPQKIVIRAKNMAVKLLVT